MNQQDEDRRRSEGLSPLRLVGIGFELVAPLLAGLFGGRWADDRFGTRPWLLLAGAVLGAVAGLLSFLRRVRGGSA